MLGSFLPSFVDFRSCVTHEDRSSMAGKARQMFPKQVSCVAGKEVSRAAVVARFMLFAKGLLSKANFRLLLLL